MRNLEFPSNDPTRDNLHFKECEVTLLCRLQSEN